MWLSPRYHLRGLLGSGGMGTVFLTYDAVVAGDVALKIVRRDVTNREDALRRLRDEVRLAQKISHPNICRTHDLEEFDGHFFVKMEYIVGETLAQRRKRLKRLPVPEALRIAREIALGLQAAHAQDVVHCDLKPENVLIAHSPERAVLMDFGLARLELRGRGVLEGEVSGTPAYMAPEQLSGGPVDARTDLYAFGCVLYELVVGRPPYPEATTIERATEFAKAPVPDPRSQCSDIPVWLSRIIQQLLAKDPEQRPPSVTVLLAKLEGPRPYPWRRLAAVLVLLAVLAAGAVWQQRNQRLKDWHPDVRALPAFEENSGNAVISPDGRTLAYNADRGGVWRLYVLPLDGTEDRVIADAFLYPIRWTHDSRSILGITQDSRALRISADSGAVTTIATDASQVEDCAGRLILAVQTVAEGRQTDELVEQAPSGARRRLHVLHKGAFRDLRCDPTGRWVAYAHAMFRPGSVGGSDIHVLNLQGGAPRRLTFDGQSTGPVFAPDGRTIVFSSVRGGTSELWEIPVEGGQPMLIPTGMGRVQLATNLARATSPDISRDGRLLVYTEETPSLPVFAIDLRTGASRRVTFTLDAVSQLHVTPDGRELIVRLNRQGKNFAATLSIATGKERILAPADAVALTPDGQQLVLAVNDDTGRSFQVKLLPLAGGTARTIARPAGQAFSLNTDEEGWAHIMVSGPPEEVRGAWKLSLADGQPIREDVSRETLVEPAPKGGWRLVGRRVNSLMLQWHMVAPGRPYDEPTGSSFEARRLIAWAADGNSFLRWNGSAIIRRDVVTGREEKLLKRDVIDGGMALSHDGQTLFLAEWAGHATRYKIVNFADRLRP